MHAQLYFFLLYIIHFGHISLVLLLCCGTWEKDEEWDDDLMVWCVWHGVSQRVRQDEKTCRCTECNGALRKMAKVVLFCKKKKKFFFANGEIYTQVVWMAMMPNGKAGKVKVYVVATGRIYFYLWCGSPLQPTGN